MKQQELELVLKDHMDWVLGRGGHRANLSDADLRYTDLRGDNLSYAKLSNVDLRYADLRGTDLRYAKLSNVDLRYANLSNVDLREADLRYAIGNKRHVKSMQLEKYDITYTSEMMWIGCQKHKIDSWFKFTNEQIDKMDLDALDWWLKWRDVIKTIIELSPCEPTNNEKNKE